MLNKLPIENPVVDGTPIERRALNGLRVFVKREDLCCPLPGPQFSKIRGLYAHMLTLVEQGVTAVGILDTIHSKAGWAVSYVANQLGLQAYVFFPVHKANVGKDFMMEQHRMAAYLGAILVPMQAEAGYIMAQRAKKRLVELAGNEAVMLPVGLKLACAIEANAAEVLTYTPDTLLMHGTWVISASSGTVAASVWKALQDAGSEAHLICHMGYSRPVTSLLAYIEKMSGYAAGSAISVVDEGYEYKDAVDFPAQFPCNPYYDLKAWRWLYYNGAGLEKPVIFWNVGA